MTKKEAIENHRKMWNWIADETLEKGNKVYKIDYFIKNNEEIMPINCCYCCEYVANLNSMEIFYSCHDCPIKWDDNNGFCNHGTLSLYKKWLHEHSCLIASEYARQIANLPERE